ADRGTGFDAVDGDIGQAVDLGIIQRRQAPQRPGGALRIRLLVQHAVSIASERGSSKWAQPLRLDQVELRLQSCVLGLYRRRPLVDVERYVVGLQRIHLQIVHLPLTVFTAGWIVILGQLEAILANADDVIRRLGIWSALLSGLIVVVREDDVVLDRWRRGVQ